MIFQYELNPFLIQRILIGFEVILEIILTPEIKFSNQGHKYTKQNKLTPPPLLFSPSSQGS